MLINNYYLYTYHQTNIMDHRQIQRRKVDL